jgi:hypothetical protein
LLIIPNVFQGGDLNTAIDIGVNADNSTLVKWGINTIAMNVNWDKPILGHVLDGNTTFQNSENVITLEQADEVRNITTPTAFQQYSDRPELSDLLPAKLGDART